MNSVPDVLRHPRRLLFAATASAVVLAAGCGATSEREELDVPATTQTTRRLEAPITARLDPALRATLADPTPLRYAEGGSEAEDVPAHVRAASALRRQGDRLVVVQDDVNVLALYRAGDGAVPVLLPRGPGGHRVFERARGNKRVKMDLEAAITLPDGRLIAFGSGSNEHRQSLVILSAAGDVERRTVATFYDGLRHSREFAGSELNIEGALIAKDSLLLLQRGNGAPRAGIQPVNAIGAIELDDFLRWLDHDGPVPRLAAITPVDLGTMAGVRLGFTDGALASDGRIALLACAEASADAVQDGPVVGCRFGWLDLESRELRMTDVLDGRGRRSLLKLEGIETRPGTPDHFDVVSDLDSPGDPALLVQLRVSES